MSMFVDVSVAFPTDQKHYSLKKKRIKGSKISAFFHFYIKKYAVSFFHGIWALSHTKNEKRFEFSILQRYSEWSTLTHGGLI